jgi:hypothetical protein
MEKLIEQVSTKKDLKSKGIIADSVIHGGRFNSHLNVKALYLSQFCKIPNCHKESCVDTPKFNKLFVKKYGSKIKEIYFNTRAMDSHVASQFDDVYYFLFKDVICYVNHGADDVEIYFSKKQYKKAQTLRALAISCIKPKDVDQPHINIMYQSGSSLSLQRLEIKRAAMEVDTHYNDDFKQVDAIIKKRLNRKQDKGIILLHGAPGTGKTSYIKHLIYHIKKDVIFMPPDIAANLTNPSLMSLLLDYPDSILVIEDAENIITDRDSRKSSSVSAILNLSDGILSDCLNMQIICSFNTDLNNVDKALLRKGRLIAKYEFGKLETSKANALSEKLGFHTTFTEPQVLTDIYNQDEITTREPLRKAIGFN